MQKIKKDLGSISYHIQKLTQRPWSSVKDPNVNSQIMELLEENTENMVHDIGFGCDFLDRTPKVQETKGKINWTYIKGQNEQRESQPIEWFSDICKSCI